MTGTSATDANTLAYNAQAGEANTTVNRSTMALVPPAPVPGMSTVSLPTTNLNIGMGIYNVPAQGSVTPVKGRWGTTNNVTTIVPVASQLIPGHDGVPSELWVQVCIPSFTFYVSFYLVLHQVNGVVGHSVVGWLVNISWIYLRHLPIDLLRLLVLALFSLSTVLWDDNPSFIFSGYAQSMKYDLITLSLYSHIHLVLTSPLNISAFLKKI